MNEKYRASLSLIPQNILIQKKYASKRGMTHGF